MDSSPSERYSISTEGWSLPELLKRGKRFQEVPRISASEPRLAERIRQFEKDGIPLVIEDWEKHNRWPKAMFNVDWLISHLGDDSITVRNVLDRQDKALSLRRFVQQCRSQPEMGEELLYGKDVDCPKQWEEWVRHADVLPENLHPGGSNDFFQHLSESEIVLTLMCYLGIRDTFTPAHKDLCASSGHNLMCYTENNGSSFWFMTAAEDSPDVEQYFSTEIRKELDWEDHVASVEDFASASFTVYITEQKLGDLVLVPPRSCHQVVNCGGLTVKTSWSRMTINGLATALYHELPLYRRVCRPEQYRVKHILYRSLLYYTAELKTRVRSDRFCGDQTSRMMADRLHKLLSLFDFVLREEFTDDYNLYRHTSDDGIPRAIAVSSGGMTVKLQEKETLPLSPVTARSNRVPRDPAANLMCDFCGADIFQSFFECNDCGLAEGFDSSEIGNGLLICPSCYAEGRACGCGIMEPAQCRPFDMLLRARNDAAETLRKFASSEFDARVMNKERLLQLPYLIFHAGCLLNAERKRNTAGKTTRRCRSNHDVPSDHAIPCFSSCHSSICFYHLLKAGMHSSEIILEKQLRPEGWHQFHTAKSKSKEAYKEGQELVKIADRKGTKPNLGYKLVMLAQTYTRCRPVNPLVKNGFYDSLSDSEVVEALPLTAASSITTSSAVDKSTVDVHPAGSSSATRRKRLSTEPHPQSKRSRHEVPQMERASFANLAEAYNAGGRPHPPLDFRSANSGEVAGVERQQPSMHRSISTSRKHKSGGAVPKRTANGSSRQSTMQAEEDDDFPFDMIKSSHSRSTVMTYKRRDSSHIRPIEIVASDDDASVTELDPKETSTRARRRDDRRPDSTQGASLPVLESLQQKVDALQKNWESHRDKERSEWAASQLIEKQSQGRMENELYRLREEVNDLKRQLDNRTAEMSSLRSDVDELRAVHRRDIEQVMQIANARVEGYMKSCVENLITMKELKHISAAELCPLPIQEQFSVVMRNIAEKCLSMDAPQGGAQGFDHPMNSNEYRARSQRPQGYEGYPHNGPPFQNRPQQRPRNRDNSGNYNTGPYQRKTNGYNNGTYNRHYNNGRERNFNPPDRPYYPQPPAMGTTPPYASSSTSRDTGPWGKTHHSILINDEADGWARVCAQSQAELFSSPSESSGSSAPRIETDVAPSKDSPQRSNQVKELRSCRAPPQNSHPARNGSHSGAEKAPFDRAPSEPLEDPMNWEQNYEQHEDVQGGSSEPRFSGGSAAIDSSKGDTERG